MSDSGNGSPRSTPNARITGRRRRGHAEPAVVVDVRRAQRDPGELAQRVRLLVGQAAAAEDGDRVGAVRGLRRRGFRRDAVQRLVPAGRDERRARAPAPAASSAAPGSRAARPTSSPSGTGRRGWSGSPARLDRDSAAVDAQRHPALQRAVRAMRRDGHRSTVRTDGSGPESATLTPRYGALSDHADGCAVRASSHELRGHVRDSLHGCLGNPPAAETCRS